MAKKGGSKGSVHDSYHFTMPSEQQMENELAREKIAKVHEVFPAVNKHHIALVLQYYDFDETKTIDAFTEDGGAKALNSWKNIGNNKTKNNSKNKKRNKKKNKKEIISGIVSTTAGTDADDSSSLHSSNIDLEGEKECVSKTENGNEEEAIQNHQEQDDEYQKRSTEDEMTRVLVSLSVSSADKEDIFSGTKPETVKELEAYEEQKHDTDSKTHCIRRFSVREEKAHDIEDHELPKTAVSQELEEQRIKEEKFMPYNEDYTSSLHAKLSPRQRTGSFHRSKTPSVSDDCSHYSSSQTGQMSNVAPKRGLEKSLKDLTRQTVSLQRIQHILETGLDEANKRFKTTFLDVRKLLEKRQSQLEQEMDQVRNDAKKLLQQRQELAAELKRRADRVHGMTENEWNELRADIKQFVVERKHDEELGKTIRFCWSMDSITEEINKFGEVIHVKNCYSQRLQSAPSISSPISNIEASPSPSSSLNEENNSTAEKNDMQTTIDAVEIQPVLEKAVPQPPSQGENRPRIFSNRRYGAANYGGRYPPNPNNRGRGGWRGRGGMGGAYIRNRQYENYRHYGTGERQYEHRYSAGADRQDHFRSVEKQQDNYSQPDITVNIKVNNVNTAAGDDDDNMEFIKNSDRGHYGGYRQQRSPNRFRRPRLGLNTSRSNADNYSSRTESQADGKLNGEENSSHRRPDLINGFAPH